jgi:hypothetical protein
MMHCKTLLTKRFQHLCFAEVSSSSALVLIVSILQFEHFWGNFPNRCILLQYNQQTLEQINFIYKINLFITLLKVKLGKTPSRNVGVAHKNIFP